MLGLAEQVGRDQLGVGRVVGDHGDLRRAGQQVDPDAPVELALGLGHVRVAGADDHVDAVHPGQAERHRRQRLDAAEREDPVGPGDRRAVDERREDALAAVRRRARHDGLHAGHLRHEHGHERRREQRHAAGRQVGADARDRHEPVAGDDAGRDLVLEVVERGALRAGERLGAVAAELQVARAAPARPARSAAAISARVSSNEGGSQPSSSRETRRSSASPPRSMASRISDTRSAIRGSAPAPPSGGRALEQEQLGVLQDAVADHRAGQSPAPHPHPYNPVLPPLNEG